MTHRSDTRAQHPLVRFVSKTAMVGSLALLTGSALILAVANVPAMAASGAGPGTPLSRSATGASAGQAASLPSWVTPPSERPALSYGDQGHWGAVLQADLTELGFSGTGPTDGIFGPLTESAVKAFQGSVGLPATGVVDEATWQDVLHGFGEMPLAGGTDPSTAESTATGQPKSDTAPETIDGRPVLQVLHMIATAYGPSLQDNYPYGATNYFGQPLTPGTVAVDPSVIPLKSYLWVQGYQDSYLPGDGFLGQALDTGGAIQGDRIDIFMDQDAQIVSNFGIQPVTVYVLGKVQM